MQRKGKPTKVLPDGHPRRMADGKNAYRKMSAGQRDEFVAWMLENGLEALLTKKEASKAIASITHTTEQRK